MRAVLFRFVDWHHHVHAHEVQAVHLEKSELLMEARKKDERNLRNLSRYIRRSYSTHCLATLKECVNLYKVFCSVCSAVEERGSSVFCSE